MEGIDFGVSWYPTTFHKTRRQLLDLLVHGEFPNVAETLKTSCGGIRITGFRFGNNEFRCE